MILVGDFSEAQIRAGDNKTAVEKLMKLHEDHRYVNSTIIKKNGATILRIWLCTTEEYRERDTI